MRQRSFDLTREFVARCNLPAKEKRDVNDALYTYTSDELAEKYTASRCENVRGFNEVQGR